MNTCMSFCFDCRSLFVNGKTYSQRVNRKMSVYIEKTVDASETFGAERIDKGTDRLSPELFAKRFRASLELVNEQI